MRLVERFRLAALLLVLVAMVAFCVSQRNVALLLVVAPLTILSWYVTEGPRGRVLPRWLQNVLLLGVLAWTGIQFLAQNDLSETMGLLGRFVLWLLLVKLYGRKTTRDYSQVLALSTVLVMTGTLQANEFGFALLVFLYAGLALWTVLLSQLWAARERARADRHLTAERARSVLGASALPAAFIPAVQPVFGRSLGWQFRSLAIVAGILGAVLSVVIFVIFPRELSDLARRDPCLGSRQTGFSEDVRLFTNDRITESRREVFTVDWTDRLGEALRFSEPLYLRGAVLDRYEPTEGRWTRTRRRGGWRPIKTTPVRIITAADRERAFASLAPQPIDERFQTYIQKVTMRSLASDVVFSVYAPIGVASDDGRIFEFDPSTFLLRDSGADRFGRIYSYAVKVQPFPSEETVDRLSGGPEPVDRAAGFPVPEIAEFARSTLDSFRLEDLPSGEAIDADPELRWQRNRKISRAFAEWLQSPAFSYTTDLGAFVRVANEDPIYSFLTRYRFGHCEYFASALVAMCQSVGVESRVVTGYIAMEFDETVQAYVVRESNAHAWAEVRVGAHAWMRLDATPQETLASLQQQNRSWADRWRWAYDRMEFLWSSQVLGFDSSTQATLADRLGGAWQRQTRDVMASLSDRAKRINDFFRLGPAGYIWMGLVGFAGVLAVMALVGWRKRRRRLLEATGLDPRRSAKDRELLRHIGFWLDALDALARAGLAKPAHRLPLQHVEALRSERPAAAEAFAAVVDRYYLVRFAGQGLDAAGENEARKLVADLAAAASRA